MTAILQSWDHFTFVGEKRSERAINMMVTWEDGRLAASTLFKALAKLGLDPYRSRFYNFWYDDGEPNPNVLRAIRTSSCPVVALGRKVSAALTAIGVNHIKMTHPAARGKIRKAAKYEAHVKDALQGSGLRKWAYA